MSALDPPPENPPGKKPAEDDVAKRAYAIYVKEGRPQGRDLQNWLEAEGEMPPAAAAPSAGKAGQTTATDQAWHHLPAEEVVRTLDVNLSTGLSAAEVLRRQKESGPNASPPGAARRRG